MYHDGAGGPAPTEYYYGQGDWAPIMGVGYYKNIVQFSKGDYTYANNTQDDLAIVAGYIPFVADDYGNTLSAARSATIAGDNISASGFIERTGDVDFFSFNSADEIHIGNIYDHA